MSHNINAGRLRNYIEVFSREQSQNSFGEPTGGETFVFDAMADCNIKSTGENLDRGYTESTMVVTMLMWYDERLTSDMVIKWNGNNFDVIGPASYDNTMKSMIVTCKRVL